MTKITITQTPITQTGTNAIIQFNDGPSHPVTVQDPFSAKQEAELRWYFEEWLAFPFTGHVRAGKAAASVKTYGEALFSQLFQGEVLTEYKMALRFEGGLSDMVFEVRGDPAFHGLHWEALKDPQQKRPFAVECVFIRPNNNPPAIHIRPQPSPTLNILLVSARPGGRQDVGYRTISRPLVESLRQSSLRTHIDIVRPGTYAALVDHLQTSRSQQGDGYYHLIHFDVHGSLLPYAAYQKL
ncbi:MAG: Tfp pilus assembly protein PilF, partial [Anaerolineae bacterium]|nr:Tfp pilus assembly protein PilF [Anaerolineae bacterium]